MSAVVWLEYPNGRTHRVNVQEEIKVGEQFDLYGHRWKSVEVFVFRLNDRGHYVALVGSSPDRLADSEREA